MTTHTTTARPPCPRCGGHIQVVNTKIVGENRLRYLGCRKCGYRPPQNKLIIPLEYAPPQVRATSSIDTTRQ